MTDYPALEREHFGDPDKGTGIYAPPVNQCDGCNIGAPLSEQGNHVMPDGGYMGCTKDRYGVPKVINDRCSHGKTWGEECPACKLADAQRVVRQWGSTVDEARRVIAEAEKPPETSKSVMLTVGGKPFRCQCGCNVFHRLRETTEYRCNACEIKYEAY